MLKGRAAELRELDDALNDVRTRGVTRIVTILGAAGIGKTRLARDFLVNVSRGAPKGVIPRIFRGSAPDQGAAYSVFARTLRARFGIVEGMDPEAAKAQVRSQVSGVLEDRKVGDVVYFLGQILGLEFLDSPLIKAIEGDPQQLHLLRRAIIKAFLEEAERRLAVGGEPPRPVPEWGTDRPRLRRPPLGARRLARSPCLPPRDAPRADPPRVHQSTGARRQA